MREILFKAKTTVKENEKYSFNNVWVEGNLIVSGGKYYIHPVANKVQVEGELGKIIIMHEVIPKTICQYTGLTDKNGNEIWENDILRCHGNPKDIAKVVFGKFDVIDVETLEVMDEVIGWHTKVIETDELSKVIPFCLSMPLTEFYINRCEYEVIGNVFDNPELYKEG